MTGTRQKIRSIFLTAIMVLSVVAMTASFAGTAAAQNNSVSVNSQTINPDDPSTQWNSGPYADVPVPSITVDEVDAENQIEYVSVWTLDQNNEPNTQIGNVSVGSSGPMTVTNVGITDYTELGGRQRLAVGVHDSDNPGEVAAYDTATFYMPDDKLDREATTERQWAGQVLYTDNTSESGVDDGNLGLFEGEPEQQGGSPTFVSDLDVDDNGLTRIDTDTLGLANEEHFISDDGGETSIRTTTTGGEGNFTEFRLRSQTLEGELDEDEVQVTGEATETGMFLEGNRQGSHIFMSADGLDAEELNGTLPESLDEGHLHPLHDDFNSNNPSPDYWVTEDNGGIVWWNVPQTFDEVLDFDGLEEQEYTFTWTPADTDAVASDSIDARDPEGALEWSEPFQTEAQGDIAEFTLEMEDSTDAWVLFGSPDVNYQRLLYVQDDDNNGEVTFELNTYEAGRNAPGDAVSNETFTSEDDDIEDRTSIIEDEWAINGGDLHVNATLGQSIDTTDDHPEAVYDVGAALTNNYAVDADSQELVLSDEQAFHELNLVEGEISGATIRAAPSGNADAYDEAWEVLEASTETDEIAFRDQYVVEFQATGIYGLIDDEESLIDNPSINVGINQTLDTVGPNRDPIAINFGQEVENGAIYTDQENGTLVAVIDSRSAEGTNTQSNLNVPDLQPGQSFNASLSASTQATSGTAYDNFDVVQRSAEFEGLTDAGQFLFSPTENESVMATTTVAPGSDVRVRARQPGHIGDEFTLRFTETEVQPSEDNDTLGQINTTLDLSGISPGAEFETSIRSDTRITGVVQSFIGEVPDATVQVSDVENDGPVSTVFVDSVNLNRGGFVAIHEGAADGPIIGVSQKLESGGHQDVRVRLDEDIEEDTEVYAMAHQDTQDEGNFNFPDADEAYTDDEGNAVTASAQVSVSEETPTPTPDPDTPTPTEDPDTPTPTEDPDTPTPEDADDEGPGFGVMVALLALISAGMLAQRRRN